MTQKEWYEKLLNWVETDTRLDDMHQMQLVVLAEHLANEESGLTQRAPDGACGCGKIWDKSVIGFDCKQCGQMIRAAGNA